MYFFIILSSFPMFLSLMFFLINFYLSPKHMQKLEKSSPFECGFNPSTLSYNSFSLSFFLICLLFLLFDLEIILILPSIYSMFLMKFKWWKFSIFFLFFLLTIGLIFEFYNNALKWKI
uniref:NADH-ubiquinone oxidoreductase chain 3 n=1 Tax=Tremex columba TaxID=222809 RepID=A0A3G5BC60_TRECO|nr:NADH dehydrogenase subunit 3 [Tremex columba]AYV97236.1 NADH dehydrogenase subunit 3 [Tremex columba]